MRSGYRRRFSRTGSRRSYRRGATSFRTLRSRGVRRSRRPELKCFDNVFTGFTSSSSYNMIEKTDFGVSDSQGMGWRHAYCNVDGALLTLAPQGASKNGRIGLSVQGRYVTLDYDVTAASLAGQNDPEVIDSGQQTATEISTVGASGTTGIQGTVGTIKYQANNYTRPFVRTRVRVVVVMDKQTSANQKTLAFGDVFETTADDGESPPIQGAQARLRQSSWGRFSIMYDRLHELRHDRPTASVNQRRIDLKGQSISFGGVEKDSIVRNGLYIFFLYTIGPYAGTPNSASFQQIISQPPKITPPIWSTRFAFTDD